MLVHTLTQEYDNNKKCKGAKEMCKSVFNLKEVLSVQKYETLHTPLCIDSKTVFCF